MQRIFLAEWVHLGVNETRETKAHLSWAVCVCVRVCKTVWLSYFCKLQWAAGLAAPVFPRGLKGEYWLSCFVIQMPNVPPAKQLPPVTVLNRAALSLSLLFIAVLLASFQSAVSLVLFFLSVCCCPPSLCSFWSFPPNLPGSTFFFDLVLFITVLCFHRLPLFYFPPLSPHARFHSRPLAGVWHHSLCLLSLKGNWKRTKVIKSTIQSRYADWKKTDGTVRWVSSSESLMRATFVQCKKLFS